MIAPAQGSVFVYPGHGQQPTGFHSPLVHQQASSGRLMPGSLRVPVGRSQLLAEWRQVHIPTTQPVAVQAPMVTHLIQGCASRSFAPGYISQPAVPARVMRAQSPTVSLLNSMRRVERQQTVVPYFQNARASEQSVPVVVAAASPKNNLESASVQPGNATPSSCQSMSATKQHGIIHASACEAPNVSVQSAPIPAPPQQIFEPVPEKDTGVASSVSAATRDLHQSPAQPRSKVNPPSPMPCSRKVALANVEFSPAKQDRDLSHAQPRQPRGCASPVLRSKDVMPDVAPWAQPRHACHSPSAMATSQQAACGAATDVFVEPDTKPTHDHTRDACRTTSPQPDCRKVVSESAKGAAEVMDEDGSQLDSSNRCRSLSPPCVRKAFGGASSAREPAPDQENQRAQAGLACPARTPTLSSRQVSKASSMGTNSVHSGEQCVRHSSHVAAARSPSADAAFPLSDTVASKRFASHANRSTTGASPLARTRRRKTSVPRQSSSPVARDSGRPSLYPRVGPDRSPILRRRTVFCKGEPDCSVVADVMDGQQNSIDRRAEATTTLAQLLVTWMCKRHMTGSISAEETDLVTDILFETMPADKVKILRIDRMMQPELISNFCKEELDSITRERENQKKHKEFMMLHGTRWENVPLICSMGLDPDCGHLTPGTWLGQNAESAHSYAAKGPGPGPFHDGHRLFAMFVVAALPSYADGDEERSFGVWRMMSRKRMCPAYLVIYSAPLTMRARRPSRSASRAASPEGTSQPCRERYQRHSTPARQPCFKMDASLLEEDRGRENRMEDQGKLA
eukprot:TRINITY_DN2_c3_g1_i1.p1 TRINITY_DN2_c3_g1~~TRINITY_DN2_c3_g1_i1.p1  ORF type:complete len:797 (+),score=84.88 TRINITY_DN2_c3_g1_i1:58-2448(+)